MISTQTTTTSQIVTLLPHEPCRETFRKDYKAPEYFIKHIDLEFQLDFKRTEVKSILHMYRSDGTPRGTDLRLDGGLTLNLQSVSLQLENDIDPTILCDGQYQLVEAGLIIKGHLLPQSAKEIFKVRISVSIDPSVNTELVGLYKAGPLLCTQNEAQGFRRITYYLDRPDVMATFKVRLEAERKQFPILLSNGNLTDSGEALNERHYVVFEDPHVKPCYLFAVVAGDLAMKDDYFVRCSGKPVRLTLWCEPKDTGKLDWAMESLKKAMKWDEERFGLVYDLDWFNIVAVSYFNFGAMENKSLNIFNTCLLLATKDISTDSDFKRIMAVVGHEYFHNWTGNRVTCRDWFQLTLKEGLTVFRDQEFSSDLGSRAIERINHAIYLRSHQFKEDAGPTAHTIRPESYLAVDNLYTATVYRKGAEVIRMYETILGREGFRRGLDLYFERHDGSAVTCDDFRAAMADANGVDLTQFENWYLQAGTPVVTVNKAEYCELKQTYTIILQQQPGSNLPNQAMWKPHHIPVNIGLMGRESKKNLLPQTVIHLKDTAQEFVFENILEVPVLSIFRGFSAPVKVINILADQDYGWLMANDSDFLNRWEAGQYLAGKAILERAQTLVEGKNDSVQTLLVKFVTDGFRSTLSMFDKTSADLSFIALSIGLPDLEYLLREMSPCDPTLLCDAHNDIKNFLAEELSDEFQRIYDVLTRELEGKPYDLSDRSIGMRSLRNLALSYLSNKNDTKPAFHHYMNAENMTDRIAAMSILCHYPCEDTKQVIDDFYSKCKCEENALLKWFSAQASGQHETTLSTVKKLKMHKDFEIKNPNFIRSLLLAFTANVHQFHRIDGQGYQFIGSCIAEIDKINGGVAARLAVSLTAWQRFGEKRGSMMKDELQKLSTLNLSPPCKEIVTKGLCA